MSLIKYVFFFIFSLSYFAVKSQNLINNGDFEEYDITPSGINNLDQCNYWYNPTFATPDYFSLLGNNQAKLPDMSSNIWEVYPYSGNSIIGLITHSKEADWKEYAQTQLSESLIIGENYKVSFAITRGKCKIISGKCNKFGFLVSTKSVGGPFESGFNKVPTYEINEILSDSNWQYFSHEFIADSIYNYFTLGSFSPSSEMTIISDYHTIDETNSPVDTSFCYYFIDKVELIKIEKQEVNTVFVFPNVFTPNNDEINEYFKPISTKLGISNIEFSIINRWGEKVFETTNSNLEWNGKYKNEECSNGTYYWIIGYTDKNGKNENSSGFFELIR